MPRCKFEFSFVFAVLNDPQYPLVIIAGPCVIESERLCLEVAEALVGVARSTGVLPIFKASFDKANRTSVESFRGPGLEEGLRVLAKVRNETGLAVLTDFHESSQAASVGEVVDILQIPAFLCRQTDLLVAAGRTGKSVNIKKGQFVSPDDMRYAVRKVESTGNTKIMLTERGASFGYRDLVVDMRSLLRLQEIGYPVIYDATHSLQSLGGTSGVSGGNPQWIEPLARAAVATGAVTGVFVETHPRPADALSDKASMLPMSRLRSMIEGLVRIVDALEARPVLRIEQSLERPV